MAEAASPLPAAKLGSSSDSFGCSSRDTSELERAIASLTVETASSQEEPQEHGPLSDDVDDAVQDSPDLSGSSAPGSASNLIINYLPATVGERELKELFSPHGTVQHVKVVMDRATGSSMGYGFVKFATDAEASAAVAATNGLSIGKKRIKVSVARPSCKDIKRSKLYITNLPEGYGKDEVTQLFAPYGNIIECRTLVDKRTGASRCTAFVQFDKRVEAQQALVLNGTDLPGCKRPLLVKFAEDHHRRRAGGKGSEGFPTVSPPSQGSGNGRDGGGGGGGGGQGPGGGLPARRNSHGGVAGAGGRAGGGNGPAMAGLPMVFSPVVPVYPSPASLDATAEYMNAMAAAAVASAAYAASPQRIVTSTPPYSPSAYSPQGFSPQTYGPAFSPQSYGSVGFPTTPGAFTTGPATPYAIRSAQQPPLPSLQMPSLYYGSVSVGNGPGSLGRGMGPGSLPSGGGMPQDGGGGGGGASGAASAGGYGVGGLAAAGEGFAVQL